ncbi:molybdate ABC transporter substrate-binding protein [Agromyces aurantiacus]|uniref:Molybdate ABC transporter substrate-binding protein n=1 Tax=Agromyces aurantiacus TaxID=165814 RepID=A0ABV9R2U4_9MICO|nr:molybdate ABC transporter substrate-binding protein [Agromyces aurantiacus]MBM7506071.1 molybdate transport system substrate-binding protein [Agromyces aurantiacus]
MPRRAAALLAATLGVALAGCAPVADGAGSPATGDSSGSDQVSLTVFAAASLTEAFDELAARFEERTPAVDVRLSFGGSSALAQQLVEGAPADVFAAAAEAPMQTLVDAGLVEEPVVFATNTLELVVPAGDPAGVEGLADLARDELRIALCDPSVPCGAASDELLRAEGVEAAPDTLESDVKAVLTKVSLGEVDAALVYRTDVLAAGDAVEGIEVPAAASVVNRYPIAAVTGSAAADAAAAFVAFVTGDEGRQVLDGAGFGAP